MISQSRAFSFAIATVLMWSTVATAFKFSLAYLDIFQLLFFACLTSVSMLGIVILVQHKVLQVPITLRKHWRVTLIAALLNPCLYYLVLFEAYDRLPAQVAQPINYTWAITLTLMSIFFLNQKIRLADLIAALVCYFGVVIIATRGDLAGFAASDWVGVGLALLSTVIWAGYWIINVKDAREPVIGMFLNFLIALPVVAFLWFSYSKSEIVVQGLIGAVYIGLFEMSLAFLCWSMALRLTSNTARISNLIFLSPFLSLVFINRVLGETIFTSTYIGLAFIVGGLIFQQWSHASQHRVSPGTVP